MENSQWSGLLAGLIQYSELSGMMMTEYSELNGMMMTEYSKLNGMMIALAEYSAWSAQQFALVGFGLIGTKMKFVRAGSVPPDFDLADILSADFDIGTGWAGFDIDMRDSGTEKASFALEDIEAHPGIEGAGFEGVMAGFGTALAVGLETALAIGFGTVVTAGFGIAVTAGFGFAVAVSGIAVIVLDTEAAVPGIAVAVLDAEVAGLDTEAAGLHIALAYCS
ncbi:hypothetical protein GOP47_0020250 [Adiantum capillus-veneris]|uniref:Uncharacterized protein n=1 Tax=Adiantum capillus-veneris TaxID=13818 RepID=A0A9D4UCW3_ADICA|nr:hypothetical protein GOP47_0020250 [Adiantum capillus-veneris]